MPVIYNKKYFVAFTVFALVSCKLNQGSGLSTSSSDPECSPETRQQLEGALKGDTEWSASQEAIIAKLESDIKAMHDGCKNQEFLELGNVDYNAELLKECSYRSNNAMCDPSGSAEACSARKSQVYKGCYDDLQAKRILVKENRKKIDEIKAKQASIAESQKAYDDNEKKCSDLDVNQKKEEQSPAVNTCPFSKEDPTRQLEKGKDQRCYDYKKCRDLSEKNGKNYFVDVYNNCVEVTDKNGSNIEDINKPCPIEDQIRDASGTCVARTNFADTDGDGIIDVQDQCPTVGGNVHREPGNAKQWGCPL